MKLSLFAMQALDYALTKQKIPFNPWYSDGAKMFSPKFTVSDNDFQSIWIEGKETHAPVKLRLTLKSTPQFFENVAARLISYGGVSTDSMRLTEVLTDWLDVESNKPDAIRTLNGNFPVSSFATVVRYESGLALNAVDFAKTEYDLVGFEQSSN